MNNPNVSVVIIGRNEGDRLIKCIKSVQTMNYPADNYEIIYVDSNSTDSSLDNARNLGVEKVFNVDSQHPCAASGRNRGLQEAAGEFVLFLDGDTILDPDFLITGLSSFQNKEIAIAYGHRKEINKESLYITLCGMDWNREQGFTSTSAGDILIRRDVINSIGAYNEIIAGEDPEMSNRVINAGYKILYLDIEMVKHDLAMHSFRQYWKHSVRSGYSYSIVADLTKRRPIPLWVKENRKITFQGLLYIGLFIFSLIFCFIIMDIIPFLLFTLIALLIIIRSFIRNKYKITDWKINILYSLHSHFLKIPMFWGQFKYLINKNQKLIEYK